MRWQQIAGELEPRLSGKKCKAMESLVQEGKEVREAVGPEGVIDAAQRVEHYELSG